VTDLAWLLLRWPFALIGSVSLRYMALDARLREVIYGPE
jgi:hypothetical protein